MGSPTPLVGASGLGKKGAEQALVKKPVSNSP